jgi:hypothetical protein
MTSKHAALVVVGAIVLVLVAGIRLREGNRTVSSRRILNCRTGEALRMASADVHKHLTARQELRARTASHPWSGGVRGNL